MELYSIIPNKTLKAIAQEKPLTKAALRKIEGMGPKRMSAFAKELLELVRTYEDADVEDEEPEPMPKPAKPKIDTYQTTLDLFKQGMTVEEIAAERHLALSTIYGHLARFVGRGYYHADQFVSQDKCAVIKEYFSETEDPALSEVRNVLGEDFEYWELKMVLAEWERENRPLS